MLGQLCNGLRKEENEPCISGVYEQPKDATGQDRAAAA